ncbi:MAG: glycosyltransferase family 39 protein [Dissulfurispiraceae bacterium]
MKILMLIYAFFLPTATGFLFVSYFSRCDNKESFFERLFLGFGLGMGMLTFEMFITALLKINFSLFVISLMQILTAALFAWLLFRSKYSLKEVLNVSPFRDKITSIFKVSGVQSFFVLLVTIWIMLKFFFVLYESATWPAFGWDSLENWSSGAKYFYYVKGLMLDHGSEHFFGKGYRTFLNYPLHIPLMQVWVSVCLGNINEAYMKYWNVVYFISVVALVYFAVRREASQVIAILAAFFLSSVPLLTYHAIDAYADLPLSYYALATAICFRRYMEKSEKQRDENYGFLVLIGVFSALCMWTKLEGILFALAFSATLLLYLLLKRSSYRNFIKSLFFYSLPIGIIGISWFTFLTLNGVKGRSILAFGLHFEVIPVILKQIFFSANFNIIFLFSPLIILLGIRTILHSDLKYLLAHLLMVMLMFLFIYIATNNYIFAMNLTAVNRSVLTFIPAMYYISALIAAHMLGKEKD